MSNVFPSLRYRDAAAGIEWLERTVGARRLAVHEQDGVVAHAEIDFGPGIVMIGSARPDDERFGPAAGRGWIYVAVDDPAAHYDRARAAGAEVADELTDKGYGRDYTIRDPEGHLWSFGDYVPQRENQGTVP